jgi:hypothetical protein
MATADEIAELRRLIAEPTDAAPYTDAELGARIDVAAELGADIRTLAASIWREKAASYAALVDVQEGNSKRTLSQLQEQALRMAGSLDGAVADEELQYRRGTRTRKIERQ